MGLKEITCIKVAPSNSYTELQFYFSINILIGINLLVYNILISMLYLHF